VATPHARVRTRRRHTMVTQELVDTEDKYAEAKAYINGRTDRITMDTETDGLSVYRNQMVGTGILSGERAFYLPFRHAEGRNLPVTLIPDMCGTILRKDRPQNGYHYGFDIKMMAKEGMEVPDNFTDGILRGHLLNENEDSFKLENMCDKYGIGDDPCGADNRLTDLLVERFGGSRQKAKGNLWRLSGQETLDYGTQDLISTRELTEFQQPHLETWGLADIAAEVEDFQSAICLMEMRGINLDLEHMETLREVARLKADEFEARLQAAAGFPINPRSPKQLQKWFGIKSTAKDVLAAMPDNPHAQMVLDYRGWQKVEGSYYKAFAKHHVDSILHANLRLTGTTSGRLSCSEPNLQAVPRQAGPNHPFFGVKECLIAPEGYWFVELDLSQAEVRVMCHYTKDPNLTDIIVNGLNMHTVVAEKMGIDRDTAKRLNFSAQYGIGAPAFAKTYGYSVPESRRYLAGYHQTFPGMKQLYNTCDRTAKTRGYLRMFTGRVRHFNHLRAPTHKGSSNLVQGDVAEMMRIAITRIRHEVPGFEQILTVHDCTCGYVKIGDLDSIRHAKSIMEDQPWCSIKMVADCKAGPSWSKAEELEL